MQYESQIVRVRVDTMTLFGNNRRIVKVFKNFLKMDLTIKRYNCKFTHEN